MSARPHDAPTLFRSLLAGIACALVLGLGLLAHSPAAHAWLHTTACEAGLPHSHHDDSAGTRPSSDKPAPSADPLAHDHVCAITAFAQGAESPAPAILVAAPLSVSVVAPLPESETRPARTDHLRPPGRAPPAA
jgi:hypothetical protein